MNIVHILWFFNLFIFFDRFLLKALDLFWHEDCLMCGCCGCRLGEVGSTLYTKANMILCKKDYFRYKWRTRRTPYDAITD